MITSKNIRQQNRKAIIELFRKEIKLEQSFIIDQTGLSKQTVNSIIVDLIKDGIVLEDKLGNSTYRGGRKPMILEFNPSSFLLAGMLVGEKRIRCCVSDFSGNILKENYVSCDLEEHPEKIAGEMNELYFSLLKDLGRNSRKIIGLGIGLPGPTDFINGKVKIFSRHKNWKNFPLKEYIQKKINVPVILDNEANVRALGEKWFGIGTEENNFITLMLREEGAGAGVVINGELSRGRNYICGQFGHMVFEKDCNNNYLNFEHFLGEKNVLKLIKEKTSNNAIPNETKAMIKNPDLKLDYVFKKFNEEEADFLEAKNELIKVFGLLVINILCSIDTDLIIIHGIYTLLSDDFYEKVIDYVNKNVFTDFDKEIRIIRSLSSKEMGLKGSAALVLEVINI